MCLLFLSGVVTPYLVSLALSLFTIALFLRLPSSVFVSVVPPTPLFCFHLRSEEQSHSFQPLPLFLTLYPHKKLERWLSWLVSNLPLHSTIPSDFLPFILILCAIFSSCMSSHFLSCFLRPLVPHSAGTSLFSSLSLSVALHLLLLHGSLICNEVRLSRGPEPFPLVGVNKQSCTISGMTPQPVRDLIKA